MVVGSLNEVLLRLVGGDEAAALVPQSVVSRDPMKKEEEGERGDGGGGGGATGRKGAGAVISGISVPYCKWLIGPPGRRRGAGGGKEGREREDEEEGSLPPGYAFSTPRRDELALTISRTEIPKTEDTLARLGSVGVRYTPVPPTSASASPSTSTSTSTCTTTNPTPTPTAPPDPPQQQSDLIAWAFLGPDGSLTSLHVEPAHRGRGLAKAVSRRLFRRRKNAVVVLRDADRFFPGEGYDLDNVWKGLLSRFFWLIVPLIDCPLSWHVAWGRLLGG